MPCGMCHTVPLIHHQTRQYSKTKGEIILGHQFIAVKTVSVLGHPSTAVETIGMLGHPSTAVKTIGMLGHPSTALHVLHEISVFDRNTDTQHTIIQEQKN